MKVIDTYLETLFSDYPHTPRFAEARSDLQKMMEEEVDELKAEGLTETQATGKVIAEFGTLDEVADELGLREEITAYRAQQAGHHGGPGARNEGGVRPEVTLERAQEYSSVEQRQSSQRATGTALYILAPAFLMFCMSIGELISPQTGEGAGSTGGSLWTAVGFVGLLALIAAAMAISRKAKAPLKRFVDIQEREFAISPATDRWVKQLEADHKAKNTGITSVAVGLFVVSALAVVIPSVMNWSYSVILAGVGVLLILVAVGTWLLTYQGWATRVVETLCDPGFSFENSSSPVLRVLGAIYWPLLIAIFLLWSLVFDGWGNSWVVFPVGAVLFWVLTTLAATVEKNRQDAR